MTGFGGVVEVSPARMECVRAATSAMHQALYASRLTVILTAQAIGAASPGRMYAASRSLCDLRYRGLTASLCELFFCGFTALWIACQERSLYAIRCVVPGLECLAARLVRCTHRQSAESRSAIRSGREWAIASCCYCCCICRGRNQPIGGPSRRIHRCNRVRGHEDPRRILCTLCPAAGQ